MHEHCGCASRTSVGGPGERASRVSAGQRPRVIATSPGVFSYAQSTQRPATAPASHNVTPAHNKTARMAPRASLVAEPGVKDSAIPPSQGKKPATLYKTQARFV